MQAKYEAIWERIKQLKASMQQQAGSKLKMQMSPNKYSKWSNATAAN